MHLSLLVSGSSGGGERRPEHHPSGGQGTQSQCQRTGPDALPGRSTALPVHLHLPHMSVVYSYMDNLSSTCKIYSLKVLIERAEVVLTYVQSTF